MKKKPNIKIKELSSNKLDILVNNVSGLAILDSNNTWEFSPGIRSFNKEIIEHLSRKKS